MSNKVSTIWRCPNAKNAWHWQRTGKVNGWTPSIWCVLNFSCDCWKRHHDHSQYEPFNPGVGEASEQRQSKIKSPSDPIKTGYIVDITTNDRKIRTNNTKKFAELCGTIMSSLQSTTKENSRIYLVFDSFLKRLTKDCKHHRQEKEVSHRAIWHH